MVRTVPVRCHVRHGRWFASRSTWPSFLRPISVVSANHYEPLVGQRTLLRFLRYMPYATLGMVLSERQRAGAHSNPNSVETTSDVDSCHSKISSNGLISAYGRRDGTFPFQPG